VTRQAFGRSEMSITPELLFVLIAIAYLGAWWRGVRIVFGDRFVPVEWIPIFVLAVGVPMVVADLLATSSLHGSESWLIGSWAFIPVPVIIGSFLRTHWRNRMAKEKRTEYDSTPDGGDF
jgi:hypothetical protein